MKKIELYLQLLRIPVDFAMIVLAFVSAYHSRLWLGEVDSSIHYFYSDNFIWLYVLPLALYMLMLFFLFGVYRLKFQGGYWSVLKEVVNAVLLWLSSIIVYFFLIRDFPFSRFVLLGATVLTLVYISVERLVFLKIERILQQKGYGQRKIVLLISDKSLLKKVLKVFQSDLKFKIVGYIADRKLKVKNLKYYGVTSKLEEILKGCQFEDLLQVGECKGHCKNQDLIDLCRFYHKEYLFVPEVFDVKTHNIMLSEINGFPVFRVKSTSLDGWGRIAKRVVDVFGALSLLILLSPLLLVVAVLIKLDSRGPLFFKYDKNKIVHRIGVYGKPFYMYKFRTMRDNSHSLRYGELAKANIKQGGGPLVKIKNDPRVTRLGWYLRRLDIDELPQLWNVLKGDMSLVGPRPHLIEEVMKYEKHHRFVLAIKPGITGMAQVSGRSDLEFEDEVLLDTFYIENWSLWLDLKILLKTAVIVAKGHNEFAK